MLNEKSYFKNKIISIKNMNNINHKKNYFDENLNYFKFIIISCITKNMKRKRC